ncbi:alginate export family protein [Dyadobacter sp. CY356]|uniref:alginate export family protein n=1 Tax=Dyadobacter sp. CY356 TaxID=2906442 RepID=UPI001F1623B1|nr:alginate export family protein [Dyadobacter sp. CY356]MCF0054834.1 alginate export family protein [Dyadobacter sp. CY356]
MRYLFILFLFLGLGNFSSFSQSADTVSRELIVDFEIRPRVEFRNNFMLVPADSTMPELFATQRNRVSVTYLGPKFKFHVSPQEIHVWGKDGRTSRVGNINAFELYIEPYISNRFAVRIGRQALSLDNGRLFSAAPWSQQSRAHEGIRLFYKNKVTTDLTLAFTRPYSKHFDAAFSPVASHQYKFLVVHHLKYKINKQLDLTTINAMDVFEKTNRSGHYYPRVTNGGRLDYTQAGIYATVNAYYQYGRNATSKNIRAYYIQPEISTKIDKTTLRLGAEILSGNKGNVPDDVTNSFVPLYGVAWKFMGNMNLFTRFPADVNDKGLINPYLFAIFQMNKKLSLRADFHLFYSQHQLKESGKDLQGKYLGFENDLSLNYRPFNRLEVIYGFSYTPSDKRMEVYKKVPDASKTPVWSYLMISYTPKLFYRKWKYPV